MNDMIRRCNYIQHVPQQRWVPWFFFIDNDGSNDSYDGDDNDNDDDDEE